jgi:nucleotide-binding universal stress UspA family protein
MALRIRRRAGASGTAACKRRPRRTLLNRCGCIYDFKIVFGKPAEVITRVAMEDHGIATVMGPRGLGRLKRFFFGSISDAVWRATCCPVTLAS